MDNIVSLGFEYSHPILFAADESLKKMGHSPTFVGEGLVFCLVKDKISMDVKRNISCPSTEIYLNDNISPCEWVDEYLRRSLSDSYSIISSSGGLTDSVSIYRFGEPTVDFTFNIYKHKREFYYSDVALINRISYKDGVIKLSENLLNILQRKTHLLLSKQSEDFYYVYNQVFSFTTDKEIGYAQNVRALGAGVKKTSKPISNTSSTFDWENYPYTLNVTTNTAGTVNSIFAPSPPQVYPPIYEGSEQLNDEAQADGTW